MKKVAYLIVNFGGPRDLKEVEEFLIELLCDQEVIRTSFPPLLHRLLFTYVAKKRTKKVAPDYALIGGKSPIFEDTEFLVDALRDRLAAPLIAFHRYLPKTHASFVATVESWEDVDEIRVFPLFPQFSYATTGSIALWFSKNLQPETLNKMAWVHSYPAHPAYIHSLCNCLHAYLQEKQLEEKDTALLFSAHGLPQRFICTGDVYERECQMSYASIKSTFPTFVTNLSYQSQFGDEEWIRPYTTDACEQVEAWAQGRKKIVVVPLSFVSDHIETLFEIEQLYLPRMREQEKEAYRCPALNRRADWVDAITKILQEDETVSTEMLLRKKAGKCCRKPGQCKDLKVFTR